MPRIRPVRLAGLAILLGVAVAAKSSRPDPGCGPHTVHADSFLTMANTTFTRLSGLHLAKYGWQVAPRTVQLETRTATCDAVVAAHNAFTGRTSPDYHVTSPLIARAGPSFLVEVPPTPKRVETLIFIYDSTLKFTTIY